MTHIQLRNTTVPRAEYDAALEKHDVRILPVWESDGKGGTPFGPT